MKKAPLFVAISAITFSVNTLADQDVSPEESTLYAGLLDHIIVTATKLTRPIADIAGTVSVISEQRLQQQVASDLDDLIRYQPGISMDTSGRGGNQGFIIRGIGGNRVLTLVDGVRSNDIYGGGPGTSYGRDSFEVDDLKKLEIIHGPASVLYGADALGGAVILHTKDPQDYLAEGETSHMALRAAHASANNQQKIGFSAATQVADWGFMAQYTQRDFEEKDIQGDAELNPQDGVSKALLLKSVWTPNEAHRFSATIDLVTEDIDYQLDRDELSSSVTSSVGRDESERYRVSLNHSWQLTSAFADSMDTHVFWQDMDALQNTVQQRHSFSFAYTPYGTAVERNTDFEFNQEITGFGSTLVKEFANSSAQHALVYGINYEITDTERPRNRCETALATAAQTCDILAYPGSIAESFPNKTVPDTETTRGGIFLQDEIVLGNGRWTVIPGIRYDYYKMEADANGVISIAGYPIESVTEEDISFNFGLIHELNEQISLFAQYAEGFRPPNFDEANQSYVNYSYYYGTVPNPDLEPETSRGVELGIRANMPNYYLGFALFKNDYDDFIDNQYVGNSQQGVMLFQDKNINKAQTYGAELMASWHLSDQLQLRSSAAYTRGDDETSDQPLDSIEPLTGMLGLAYSAADNKWGIETTLTLVAKKDRVSQGSVTSSGYGLVDLFGHYHFTDNATLRYGIFNLLDKQYARWANIEGLVAVSSANSVALAQEPGREFRVGLNYTF